MEQALPTRCLKHLLKSALGLTQAPDNSDNDG